MKISDKIGTEECVSLYLNVSNIIVKSTNFPNKGTTREVGGMISASSRKNTVRERRILIDKLTWRNKMFKD